MEKVLERIRALAGAGRRIYSFGNRSDAEAYMTAMNRYFKGNDLSIYRIDVNVDVKFIDFTKMSDDAANNFISKYGHGGSLYPSYPSNLDGSIRSVNYNNEYYFNESFFHNLSITKAK